MGGPEDRRKLLEKTAVAVRACTRCRLHRSRTKAVPGEGPADARLFLIGEAPGRDEDASGRPFVGAAGKVLDRSLVAVGLSRKDVFITNVVKCRPPANRAPRADEVDACRPYLMNQIGAVGPRILVTFGATALRGLMGPGLRLSEARGKLFRFDGIPVLPTYHPAAVLYNRRLERTLRSDLRKAARFAHGLNARTPRPSRGATRSGRRRR